MMKCNCDPVLVTNPDLDKCGPREVFSGGEVVEQWHCTHIVQCDICAKVLQVFALACPLKPKKMQMIGESVAAQADISTTSLYMSSLDKGFLWEKNRTEPYPVSKSESKSKSQPLGDKFRKLPPSVVVIHENTNEKLRISWNTNEITMRRVEDFATQSRRYSIRRLEKEDWQADNNTLWSTATWQRYPKGSAPATGEYQRLAALARKSNGKFAEKPDDESVQTVESTDERVVIIWDPKLITRNAVGHRASMRGKYAIDGVDKVILDDGRIRSTWTRSKKEKAKGNQSNVS